MKGKKIVAILLSVTMCLSVTTVGFASTTREADTSAGTDVSENSETAEEETAVDDVVFTANESDAEILYSGTSGDLEWSIDSDGLFTLSGTGDYKISTSTGCPPWYSYRDYIKSSVVTVSEITSTRYMFYMCNNLENVDLSGLDTTNVTDMSYMFCDCNSLDSLDVSNFDTSNVTTMQYMFDDCNSLDSLDVSNFDTSNVTDMGHMFGCSGLKSLDVSHFDTTYVRSMFGMFSGCEKLVSLDVSNFDTTNVTSMRAMFIYCRSLTNLDISNFDTTNVTNMDSMFFDCESLTSLDLNNFDTSNVTDMGHMFDGCHSLISLDLSNFNTTNVTSMSYMFRLCTSLINLDISNIDTSNVTDVASMFSGCSSLTSLDLSGFNTTKLSSSHIEYFVNACSSLLTVIAPANLKYSISLPDGGTWYDESGNICTKMAAGLSTIMTYMRDSIVRDITVSKYDEDEGIYTEDYDALTVGDTVTFSVEVTVSADTSLTFNESDWTSTDVDGAASSAVQFGSLSVLGPYSANDSGTLETYYISITAQLSAKGSYTVAFDSPVGRDVSVEFTIMSGITDFTWIFKQDDFCFTNSYSYFGTGPIYIEDSMLDTYLFTLSDTEIKMLAESFGADSSVENLKNNRLVKWDGACFGMSLVSALIKTGNLSAEDLGASTTYGLAALDKSENTELESILNLYHISQVLNEVKYAEVGNSKFPELMENMWNIANKIGVTEEPYIIGLNADDYGHAVVCYGAESGDFSTGALFWKEEYDKRLLVYDPTSEKEEYIYINEDFSMAELSSDSSYTTFGIYYGQQGSERWNSFSEYMDIPHYVYLNVDNKNMPVYTVYASGGSYVSVSNGNIDEKTMDAVTAWNAGRLADGEEIEGDNEVYTVYFPETDSYYEIVPADGETLDALLTYDDFSVNVCGAAASVSIGIDGTVSIIGAEGDLAVDITLNDSEFDYMTISGDADGDITIRVTDESIEVTGSLSDYTVENMDNDCEKTSAYISGGTDVEVVIEDGAVAPYEDADGDGIYETEISTSADTLLVRRGNWFYVNYTLKGGNADMSFTYGRDTDEVLIGDWDGDGIDTICVRRGNRFYFSNTLGGQSDFYIDFGRTTDEVVVGDWDGDGYDTICVRRGNHYYINNTLESGNAAIDFTFGRVADEVLAGDWDGDGYDTLCIRRGITYYINNTLEGGNAAIDFTFGRTADSVLSGDWDGDGYDTLCIRRGNHYYINNTLEGGNAAIDFTFGRDTDEVYAGTWI